MARSIEAQVIDARHLELRDPIQLKPGAQVVVTILEARDWAENLDWQALSAQGLAGAYDIGEPDYPVAMIKSPNPEYNP